MLTVKDRIHLASGSEIPKFSDQNNNVLTLIKESIQIFYKLR